MKTLFIFRLFIIFNFIIFIASCRPHDCPDPVDNTVYVTTLMGADFMDTQVTTINPTTTHPTRATITASAWTWNGTPGLERGYFKFNYSSIPAGAVIRKATLTFFAHTTDTYNGHNQLNGPNNWYIRRTTSSWDVNTVTWNTQPTNNASTQIELPASTSNSQNYIIDLTNFVKEDFTNPTSPVNGYVMQLATEIYYRNVLFAASDHTNASLRPRLEIEYTK